GSRYRLDRYYQISNTLLANSFCEYLDDVFINSTYAPLLNIDKLPNKRQQKRNIIALKSKLKKTPYSYSVVEFDSNKHSAVVDQPITVMPFIGYGRRKNQLNRVIRQTIKNTQQQLLIFTPYFNLPPALAKDVVSALKRGVKTTLIIGDKTANDFFIKDENAFSFIGIVPYIYEILLKRFVKRYQHFIDQELLTVHLWKHEGNSFHLKGLISDERYHLLTGSNLNPRAWTLDLENGLLLDDPSKSLMKKVTPELMGIMQHTKQVNHYNELDSIKDYPAKPQKLLKKIRFAQIDRILKRFL
ncbi:MAG: CDP-diacylglycerol--serine O-phosphatidyltransferase, partial [Colwellia sp.]|nr:CDP-diacylglycerol--serine O-phosphatidyltransferase [Colwellia sp.]